MSSELAKVAKDERKFVRNVVLLGEGLHVLDGCSGQRDFMDGGACDDMVGWQMQKLMTAGWASNGVQVDAVKGAGSRGVGWIRLVVGLNAGSKWMLAIEVVIQWKACDDGTR